MTSPAVPCYWIGLRHFTWTADVAVTWECSVGGAYLDCAA